MWGWNLCFFGVGGVLSEAYDVFLDVDRLDEFFNNVDVYDSFHEDVDNKFSIIRPADGWINIGLDHKDNLMKKAERLGLYKEFVVSDANKKLPFEDNSLASVFSNIIYWLDSPEHVFKEIYRILRRSGRACVMLPNTSFLTASFYNSHYVAKGKPEEFQFLELIDRGRASDNIKVVKTRKGWEEIICNAGFVIEECIPHLSKTLMQMWDIGLRPIFPFIKDMTDYMPKGDLLKLKKKWVYLFETIGYSIIMNDESEKLMQGEEHCFFCFIIRKQ